VRLPNRCYCSASEKEIICYGNHIISEKGVAVDRSKCTCHVGAASTEADDLRNLNVIWKIRIDKAARLSMLNLQAC
jgi:hypothetical protein